MKTNIILNDLNFIHPYLVKEAKEKISTIEYSKEIEEELINKMVRLILQSRLKDEKSFKTEINHLREINK